MRNRRVKKQFLRLVSKGPYYKPTQVGELRIAPVNGGRNYNGPKVAKFLVG